MLQRGDASRGFSTEPAKGDLPAEKEHMASSEAGKGQIDWHLGCRCVRYDSQIQIPQLSKKTESLAQGGFCLFSPTAVGQKIATREKQTQRNDPPHPLDFNIGDALSGPEFDFEKKTVGNSPAHLNVNIGGCGGSLV